MELEAGYVNAMGLPGPGIEDFRLEMEAATKGNVPIIGSIFVITIVMGDFVTIGVMGGQQIASAGKIIEARLNALQFPAAAANAVILLGITILIISALTRIVDIRKEL